MEVSDIERTRAFQDRLARAQATDIVDFSWGSALLQADFPLSQYHNRLNVTSAVSAAEVLTTADRVLGTAGARHRYVSVDDDALGRALRPDFAAAGYGHETIVTMIYRGPDVASAVSERHQAGGHGDVREVSLDVLRPALVRHWRSTLRNATEEEVDQLADRAELYDRGTELLRLAVYEDDEIAAHGDLSVDRAEGLAQFENLITHTHFRGRGHGNALIHDALRRAGRAGCELAFLTAGIDDWPYRWYHRLGYVDACRTHHFSRLD